MIIFLDANIRVVHSLQYLSVIIVGVGLLCCLVFYIGTKEVSHDDGSPLEGKHNSISIYLVRVAHHPLQVWIQQTFTSVFYELFHNSNTTYQTLNSQTFPKRLQSMNVSLY